MIYPIRNWKNLRRGYVFRARTFYKTQHLGLDVIAPKGTIIFAWQDLEVTKSMWGPSGGNTIWVECPGVDILFRLMHLNAPVKKGKYKMGQILAYVGNTGALTTGPHLHIDLSKGKQLILRDINNFIDPELYFAKVNG